MAFLRQHVPAGAKVLDVGCGEGRLVEGLNAAGFDATGIDSSVEAVETGLAAERRVTHGDFVVDASGSYDALFFGGSLHHLHPLDRALARSAALLEPGGLLLADEFDVEAPDVATARWFFDMIDLAELLEPGGHDEATPHDPGADPLERWRARHRHEPPLASAGEMLAAVAARFEILERERCAYLYWYALRVLDRRSDGHAVGARWLELERRLIDAGRIRPVGLRVVARTRRASDGSAA